MTEASHGPGDEEGITRIPVLPIFPEANLPSAKQPGLLIGVTRTADSVLVLAISKQDNTWELIEPDKYALA